MADERFMKLNEELKTGCSEEEISYFSKLAKSTLESLNFIDTYKLREPVAAAEPERAYYTPSSNENPYNAWYVKCNIEGDKTGKLFGKKIAIKDNIAVANIPMMIGSDLIEGHIPENDATVVNRILSHGGTISGKTTCEDMCVTCVSYFTKYGPVRNPINKEHSAGGSSSGNAVVVKTGEVDMAIGSDQGGSVRIPASNCGIVGLKPTHGLVPYTGACSMGPIFDHLGPMARTVSECALLLECIAGKENQEYSNQICKTPVLEYSKPIYPNVRPVRAISIAILKEGVELCESNVQKVFLQAIDVLKGNDLLEISEVSFPNHLNASKAIFPLANSSFYDVTWNNYGDTSSCCKGYESASLVKKLQIALKENLHKGSLPFKFELLMGRYIHENHGTYYRAKASNIISELSSDYTELLSNNDFLIMPTSTNLPARIPRDSASTEEKITPMLDLALNVEIFNATGHPAISINSGNFNGLPVGMQIVGKCFDDIGVLNCASIIEEALHKITETV